MVRASGITGRLDRAASAVSVSTSSACDSTAASMFPTRPMTSRAGARLFIGADEIASFGASDHDSGSSNGSSPLGAPDESQVASVRAERPARHPRIVVVSITGRIDRADAARIGRLVRDELAAGPASLVVCDVGGLTAPDAAAVDATCRIRLAVRRHGGRLRLRHASEELRGLLDLMGLDEILCGEPRLSARAGAAGRTAGTSGPCRGRT